MAQRSAAAEARAFRLHAWAFVVGNSILSGANWLTAGGWWAFWPLAAWSVVLAAHYLVHKSRSVDERWAEERTADLHSKSYDASHIDRIAEDHGGKAAEREKK
jgi:hypothetical protein